MNDAAQPPPRALGLSVSAAQLMLALSWTAYVAFLPALARQAGLPPSAVVWLLIADQCVFLLADYACGVASDRVLALHARLGPWLVAATGVSAAAFVALPVVAPVGSASLFVAITLLWTVTSSALRAPALNLISRHAARPAQPAMVALAMLGLGLAAAVAPWLVNALAGRDPRWPFVLASVGVCAAAGAMALAERRARPPALPADAALPVAPGSRLRPSLAGALAGAALLAALAFQVHSSLNATAQYRRFLAPDELAGWLPVFWAGFNLALWPAMKLAPRVGELRLVAVAAAGAAWAAGLGATASSLIALAVWQALAGAAWAAMMAGGFMSALALGHVGREGRLSGAVSSSLAGAAAIRLGLVASGVAATMRAQHSPWIDALPVVLWLMTAALLAWALRPRAPGR